MENSSVIKNRFLYIFHYFLVRLIYTVIDATNTDSPPVMAFFKGNVLKTMSAGPEFQH